MTLFYRILYGVHEDSLGWSQSTNLIVDLFIGQQVTDSQQVVSLVNAPIVVVILVWM